MQKLPKGSVGGKERNSSLGSLQWSLSHFNPPGYMGQRSCHKYTAGTPSALNLLSNCMLFSEEFYFICVSNDCKYLKIAKTSSWCLFMVSQKNLSEKSVYKCIPVHFVSFIGKECQCRVMSSYSNASHSRLYGALSIKASGVWSQWQTHKRAECVWMWFSPVAAGLGRDELKWCEGAGGVYTGPQETLLHSFPISIPLNRAKTKGVWN